MRYLFVIGTALAFTGLLRSADDIRESIAKLGSPSFVEREQAAKELTLLGMKALPDLRLASQNPETEIRRRAQRIVADLQTNGQKRVEEYLRARNAGGGRLTAVADPAVGQVLPASLAYTLIYPLFPVARIAPAGFGSQNVLVLGPDGPPTLINSAKELEDFAGKFFVRADSDAKAKTFVLAYLRLTQEFSQDGFFKFTIAANEIKKTATGLSGRIGVEPTAGNKGEILVALKFDDGRLQSVSEKRNVVAGIRPICQATKLLDSDPIVRTMAEQSLRVLGSLAKPYLDEQRAAAKPELRQAIDRLWERIVAEKR